MNYLQNNEVEICHNNDCIRATGKDAEIISNAIAFMFFCIAIGLLIKAAR